MVAPLPRWLHVWAILTALAALGAMVGGTVVTTLRVGMADPVWPTYPWHLALISWSEPSAGFLIEHTHRALAYAAGFFVVVLTIGLWRNRCLPWLRFTCLIAIVIQGLIGGFRVRLDAWLGSDLKLIHGSFAQVVFGLAVCAVVTTSRSWREPSELADQNGAESLRWASLLCILTVFVQIVLGSFVRQTNSSLAQRGHLMIAFVVVATVAWLLHRAADAKALELPLRRAVWCLAGLLALQIMLGVETWMTKFVPGVFPDAQPVTLRQAIIRTAHYVVGSGVFGLAVVTSLHAYRHVLVTKTRPVPHLGGLEGAL
jgi:heme A synthase